MAGSEKKCGNTSGRSISPVSKSHGNFVLKRGPPLREGDTEVLCKALNIDGKPAMVKVLTVHPPEHQLARELLQEMTILGGNEHENILRYSASSWTEDFKNKIVTIKLYMEFVSHDTLETLYQDFDLTERQVGFYTRGILTGIAHLHKQNILHRDIRCANIWINDQGVCKLANFGKARQLQQSEEVLTKSRVGNEHWMAPEIVNQQPYQKPVDIWSLGCTVLEMLTKSRPFEAFNNHGAINEDQVIELLKASQVPPIPRNLGPNSVDFIRKCLQVKPGDRPTAYELLEHSFVNPLPTQAMPVLSSSEEQSAPVFMPHEEKSIEVFKSQSQGGHFVPSVNQMCRLISEKLEENATNFPVVIISNDWLIEWQADDDKVYTKLLGLGFLKTFETDVYSCFDQILDTCVYIDGGHYNHVPMGLNEVPKLEAAQGSAQDMSAPSLYNASTETKSQEEVKVNVAGGKSEGKAGNSEDNMLITTGLNSKQIPGSVCSEDCPHIPMGVWKEGNHDVTSSDTKSNTKLVVMKHDTHYGFFKVILAVSCCVRDTQLCIKFSCFKGEVSPHITYPGLILRQTRLSLSAKLDYEDIVLRLVDPDNEQSRVCSRGKAKWNHKHGGKTWWAIFSPSINCPLLGGASLGQVGMSKTDQIPDHICARHESLDLVELKVGDKGCYRSDYKKVIVLQRNVINTFLTGENIDVTCMDSHIESHPIVLISDLDFSIGGMGVGHKTLEIICCAEVEISFLPDNKRLEEKIRRELLQVENRKPTVISLCRDHGHVTFEGIITTNVHDPI